MVSANHLLGILALAGTMGALAGCYEDQKVLQSRPADPQKSARRIDRPDQEQRAMQPRRVVPQKPVQDGDRSDEKQKREQPSDDGITLLVPVDRSKGDSQTVVIRVMEHVQKYN